MATIRIKPGVQPKLINIVAGIANAARDLVDPAEVWITSAMDGIHSKDTSLHYALRAVDIRMRNFPTTDAKLKFRERLLSELGPAYEVFYENAGTPNEHLHIGFDPH